MPRRNDIQRVMILGSGPIKIGQAAEFDFSGSQACRALREDGYEVILVNSGNIVKTGKKAKQKIAKIILKNIEKAIN